MRIPESLRSALLRVAESLQGSQVKWLVGGSCGLLLQGVALAAEPRDLDVYADADAARAIYERLAEAAVDRLEESRTAIYRSELAHFRLGETTMELVGGFEVSSGGSRYRVEVDGLLAGYGTVCALNGMTLRLTPLAHELTFNLLRDRPDRYEAIAAVMRVSPGANYPAMQELIRRNAFSESFMREADQLLHFAEWEGKAGDEPGSPLLPGR